ncbi:50S ribosomal protein L24 [Serratia symbiotica]|nr:50S ribosomal protein L24 [Serratia symbiotica]
MASKIRNSDKVIVITGKDKGKCGKVKKILSCNKVIIEGINIVKKHQKPIQNQKKIGGIILKEAAIHISNIALFNINTGKADRVGFRFENNKKVRFFKSTNITIK